MSTPEKLKSSAGSRRYLLWFLYLPVYLICFFLLERHITPDSAYWVSYMPLDDCIPFVEAFAIPYCTWYPFLLGTAVYLAVRDRREFCRYAHFLVLGLSISLLICLIFPNGQDLRPAVMPRDNVFTRLVSLIYAADTNTNVFPSMHVVGMIAGTSALFHAECARRLRFPAAALTVLVAASTVFIKQHSFLDILGGAALCIPLYAAVYAPGYFRDKKGGNK